MAGAYDDTVIIEDRCGRNPCSTVESDIKAFGKDELAFLLNLAGLILVLSWIIPYIVEFFNDIMKLVNIGG